MFYYESHDGTPVLTEKISSPTNMNVYDILFSAFISKMLG